MNYKKLIAGVLCSAMVFGMGASASADTTATANVEPSQAEASSKKKVKILCHYDPINGGKSYAAKQLKSKYGVKAEWVPTTWNERFSDLGVAVMGGQGIDLFTYESALLPKEIVNNNIQSVNSYVDMDKSVFGKYYSEAMEQLKFNDKYYGLVTGVSAANVVYYSKKTIKAYGLEDPYTLWQDGKWNWDTFKKELDSFVNVDEGRFGLDGWYFESALTHSAGKPVIGNRSGKLTSYLSSKSISAAMKFGESLYNDGLIANKEDFNWAEKPEFMGEGKELFYIGGTWLIQSDPKDWSLGIAPADLGVVPVPSPKGSKNYMEASLSGYALLKGAANPKYAVKFAELEAKGSLDKKNIASLNNTSKKTYKWSNTVIKSINEINETARKYPVVELAGGASSDIASLTVDSMEMGIRASFHGTSWSSQVNDLQEVVEALTKEVNQELKKM